MRAEPGQVWMADGGGGQRAHYLTLELTMVEFQSGPLPRWMCLCLDSGRVGLVSLDAEEGSSVAWTRIA